MVPSQKNHPTQVLPLVSPAPSGKLPLVITTRPAIPADMQFLAGVFLLAGREMITASRGYWDEERERTQFTAQLKMQSTHVIQKDGSDVGFFTVVASRDALELDKISIAPSHQGRGIGSQVIRDLIGMAMRGGLPIVLYVLKPNTRAFDLYKRLGFKPSGESDTHFQMRWESALQV